MRASQDLGSKESVALVCRAAGQTRGCVYDEGVGVGRDAGKSSAARVSGRLGRVVQMTRLQHGLGSNTTRVQHALYMARKKRH